jgi:hypothetical protein
LHNRQRRRTIAGGVAFYIKTNLLTGDQGHGPAGGRASPDQISIRSPIVNLITRSECVG